MNENNGLQILITLQQTDSRIGRLQEEIARLPVRLEELEENRQACTQQVERALLSLEDHRKLRRHLEGEVATSHEKLSRFKTQLMEVKTNREYQALLQEITTVEEEIAGSEDRILESMLAVDEQAAQLEKVQQEVRQTEAELAERRKELELRTAQAKQEIDQLTQRRHSLEEQIPEELRERYDRLVSARGVALAEARDQSCQVCHVRLRPQLYNEVKTGSQILTCENCNRILFFAQD